MEGSIQVILQHLTLKRKKKLKTQNLKQSKMETCMKMKMSEFWHIPEDVQV